MSRFTTWAIGIVVIAILAVVVAFQFAEYVDEGEVAVVYTAGSGAKEVLTPGLNWVAPLDKFYHMNVRQEVIEAKLEVNTSDGKIVTIPVKYNMQITADEEKLLKLFKSYGKREKDYYSKVVVYQQLHKIAKETIVGYTTLEIFTDKMTTAAKTIGDELSKSAEPLGFTITGLSLLSPQIDAATAAAIDAQVAAQQANELLQLEAQNDAITQSRALAQKEADAAQSKVEAEAAAYKKKTNADAEAYANQALAKSLTEPVLKKMELEARLQHGWIEINGASVIVDKKE